MSKKFAIREMLNKDLEDAFVLWRVSFNKGFSDHFDTREMLERYLIRNPGFSSVAYDEGGKLVGALLCGHDGRRGSIYHTAVIDEYRGNGIGKKMEERSLSKLKEIGIETGFLFINISNPGSRELWESIGWQLINDVRYLYKEF